MSEEEMRAEMRRITEERLRVMDQAMKRRASSPSQSGED